ncbi:TrlF family AAA-like ATPase [Escherichia coli]
MFSRGSEWNKWDLHVHTPASVLRNEYRDDWDKYIIDLFTKAIEENIKVIGITDYFFIDGYKKIKNDYLSNPERMEQLLGAENYELVKEIKVLPNIEFRIDKLVIGKESDLRWNRKVNYHLLLCDSVSPETIEKEIINCLKFDFYSEPGARTDRRNFTKENIIEFGEKLCQHQHNFAGQNPLFVGMINSCFNLDELKDILNTNGKFKGKYILALPADEDLSKVSWKSQGHAVRKHLIMQSHMLFTSNSGTIDFCKGEKHETIRDYLKEFGNIKPCVWGSDAHSSDKMFKPDDNRHTWIKANLSFDGLKQIIYEPESRVKIQESHPQTKAGYQTILRARFICEDKKFPKNWIYLNKDLNTIIGGKSSGKSLLLYFIAAAINKSAVLENINLADTDNYNTQGVDFEVEWDDGSISLLSDLEDTKPITYIPQLYINKLAEIEGKNQLKKLIESILKQNRDFYEFSEVKDSEIKLKNKEIKEKIELHQTFSDNYTTLCDERNKIGDKFSIEKEISSLEEQCKKLREKSGFNQQEIIKHNKLNTILKNSENRLRVVDNYHLNSTKLITGLHERFLDYTNALKSDLASSLSVADTAIFSRKYYSIIEKGMDSIRLETQKHFELKTNKIPKLIDKITQTKEKSELEITPLLLKVKEKQSLDLFTKKISIEREKLSKINGLQQVIDKLLVDAKDNLSNLQTNYAELMSLYQDYIIELSSEQYSISDDMKIIPKLSFNKDGFDKFIDNYDMRGNLQPLMGDAYDPKEIFAFDVVNHIEKINTILANTKKETCPKVKKGITKKDILYTLYDDYFFIDYEIIYNNDEIIKMSPGKRGLVLLNLLLHLSNASHPILIDQPEDNLDNRTIYEQLNRFIKQRKKTRQIILVTHNANLVVSADSECVIVANQTGQIKDGENEEYQFEYISNALENTFEKIQDTCLLKSMGIRQHVCEILEGGQDAFKEREIKYGLRF